MRMNDRRGDEVKYPEFLVRWNSQGGVGKASKGGFRRRKPIPQWQKDQARENVERMRSRMRY